MVEIWMHFPEKIENNEEKVTDILNYLKQYLSKNMFLNYEFIIFFFFLVERKKKK